MRKERNIPVHICSQKSEKSDLQYWLSKTPEERISAMEVLREQYYAIAGYTTTPRLIPIVHIRDLHS